MQTEELKNLLDSKSEKYNQLDFIENDPICIPHGFQNAQDIEISGFFAALLAWGQRKTIINKCNELMARMGNEPAQFIKNHRESDLKDLLGFKHRTFNDTDLLYFVAFLQHHFCSFDSLEDAFLIGWQHSDFRDDYGGEFSSGTRILSISEDISNSSSASSACYLYELESQISDRGSFSIEKSLNNFKTYFFSLPDYPQRTTKHISSPLQKATCKRLNMYLRWMVRRDKKGVDFGLWNRLKPAQLICPYDVHVDRVARGLDLIERKQSDWKTALELTARLREFDPTDPVKYDFALFGMGIAGEL